jgi:hypothetical protein
LLEIIILILFISLVANSAIYISRNLHHIAIKNSVKQIVFFLKLVREHTLISGFSSTLLIDYNQSMFRSQDGRLAAQNIFFLRLIKNLKIMPFIGDNKTNFANELIKLYPDGHISAGTLYLAYKKLVYKLTISVHQIPIFTAYYLNNNIWQKIII